MLGYDDPLLGFFWSLLMVASSRVRGVLSDAEFGDQKARLLA